MYIYEKVTLITELYFYYFLAAAVSTVVYRAFGLLKINRTVFSIFFASLFLFNFIFRSEGFSSFIIGPIMLTYAIAKIYESIRYERYQTTDAMKIGLAVAFGIFGDPRVIVYFFLLSVGIILASFLVKRFVRITKFIAKSYALIIPLFGVMYFMTSFVPVFQANAGRSGNYSTIAFFSSSTQPMYIIDFIANWWSNFVAASPQIMSSGLGSVNYLKTLYAGNAIAVVPPGAATTIWSLSLSVLSIFSILSFYLAFRDRSNRTLFLFFVPFLLIFLLSPGTNIRFPLFVHFIAALSNLPVVGPLWTVTVATPQYIDTYLSSFLIFFASYSVLSMSEIEIRHKWKSGSHRLGSGISKKHRKHLGYLALLFVLFMFLFANWQMIDQSYSLGQELPGELPGNQVSLDTFLSSVHPPPGWVAAYDSLYSPTNLSYTVYTNDAYKMLLKWDSSFNIGSSPGISPNSEFSSLLSDVVSQNLSNLIPTLMAEYGVKYIFFDKSQVDPDWNFLNDLNDSGLETTANTDNYTIFSLPGSSALSLLNTTFSLPGGNPESALNLTYLLSSAGYQMALSPSNSSNYTFTGNNLDGTGKGAYITLNNLAGIFPSETIPKPLEKFNGSVSAVGSHWLGNDWGDTGYNGGYYINYTFSDGTFSVEKYTPAGTSFPDSAYYVFYTNNSSNPTAGSTIPVPAGDEAIVNYSFTYTTDAPGSVTFSAGSNTVDLPYSPSGKYVSGSVLIPPGSGGFGIGFGLSKYNGTLAISNVSISYTIIHNSVETVKGHNFSFNAVPNEKYDLIFTASNSSYTPKNMKEIVAASSTGKLCFNTSAYNYMGQIAVIPFNNDTPTTSSVPHAEFQNGGTSIRLTDTGQHYLVISYSNDYSWVSPDLVYLGANSLGQQVYKVILPGTVDVVITGYEVHMYTDWVVALVVNIALPILLFYPATWKKISSAVKRKLSR